MLDYQHWHVPEPGVGAGPLCHRASWYEDRQMGLINSFSGEHLPPPRRTVDDNAPQAMRGQLIDIAFRLAESLGQPSPRCLYEATGLLLTGSITANPYGGYRTRVSRDVAAAEWPRVYDWVSRLLAEFRNAGQGEVFRDEVNRVVASFGVVWDVDAEGRWTRDIPGPLRRAVDAAIRDLGRPEFRSALDLFSAAEDAFNSRPRRDRDACANAYDALEATAKIAQHLPGETFGRVLDRDDALNAEIKRALRAVEIIRNNNFGHGGNFLLSGTEVEFVYTTCAAAIRVYTQRNG